ncbi:DUF4365 domain-containing protein [Bacillus sp. NPDC094106]|uniref:DUF4365 domain-containing protein n=1 Tax=Bacillus sp. NPDC094106 TaxID=3363949 RepID=UPI003819AC8D
MEFASYGLEVYSPEIDDHGIDFIIKDKKGNYKEIQVKSKRGMGYVYMEKTKFDITNKNLYLALLIFEHGRFPDVFLIPSEAWSASNGVFVDRGYEKPGQTSKPEYGLNISKKNYSILEIFSMENMVRDLLK